MFQATTKKTKLDAVLAVTAAVGGLELWALAAVALRIAAGI